MSADDVLNKVPWLWIAVVILSALVLLQYAHILYLRQSLWTMMDGAATHAKVHAVIDGRDRSSEVEATGR